MKATLSLLVLLASVAQPTPHAIGKKARPQEATTESLTFTAFAYGQPGSMAFHTAFHGGITTRYLLLKASLRCEELAKYLALDEKQKERVAALRPVHIDIVDKSLKDKNAEPDEQLVHPGYFVFLTPEQLNRLDLIALHFDGYASLSRESVANRLDLSPATRTAIASSLAKNRKEIFLPWFRWKFAAPLPDDIDLRDADFSGRFLVHLNHQILAVVTPKETARIVEWIANDPPSHETVESVVKLTPLPKGIEALIKAENTER